MVKYLSPYKEYFNDNQQTQADYKQKNEIRNWIEECLERFSLDYTCYIVGSTSNGFGTKSSDVDICLVVDHEKVCRRSSRDLIAIITF